MTREMFQRRAEERIMHYREQGFACSESSIRALGDLLDCPAPDHIQRLAGIFSGGAAVDGRCGICESGLIYMALLFGGNSGNSHLREHAVLLQRNMEQDVGSVMCSDLFYPIYQLHREQEEPEEKFQCIFQSGIASVAGTFYDLLYAAMQPTSPDTYDESE